MKNIVRIALCAIMMAVCTTVVQAQNNQSNEQRMSREQLAEAQSKHIAHELAFDEQTTQKFLEAYMDYQKEVWALGPRLSRRQQQAETDAEAEQAIRQRMERSQKILDLREKYYRRYSQFLTQKQIERVYELERKAMQRLARHRQGRGSQRNSARHTSTRNHARR